MTMHAMTDVRSITLPGGCGNSHTAGDLADGEHMTISCGPCEAALQTLPKLGWATNVGSVPLTPDERAHDERTERTANRVATNALAAMAGAAVGGRQAPAPLIPQDMLNELAALRDQLAEMREQMKTKAPAPSESDAAVGDAAPAKAPAKRQSRKAATAEPAE